MTVGVLPASPDFSHPADRRRPVYYLAKSGLDYEIAQFDKRYRHVYVTIAADVSLWSRYKAQWDDSAPKPRVIFDFCDDLLAAPFLKDRMRAAYYYLTGRSKRFNSSYKRLILDMISSADVVVCGSAEQKSKLDRVHPNVVVVRDYFGADIRARKMDHQLRRPNELNIFWEGLSHGNVTIFRELRQILEEIDGYRVHLHLATDPVYCKIGGRALCRPTFEVLRDVFKGSAVRFHLYDWCGATFSAIAASCDLAAIPIPHDSTMRMKPENKMLLLWELGLPVIASDTESYSRVMANAGLDFIAATKPRWKELILSLAASEERRRDYMQKARDYLERFCSEEVILSSWREVFR